MDLAWPNRPTLFNAAPELLFNLANKMSPAAGRWATQKEVMGRVGD